ncbi:Uncharacterised protein [Mycobacteroides abscessus subsp. bolletii]|nr:Uncharacterised protein [Mycobacteroides abscessus subsp. bolletii]SKH07563.1 Uncharacterised protein [Mycobacteroides abscessus subsp. bolletii]
METQRILFVAIPAVAAFLFLAAIIIGVVLFRKRTGKPTNATIFAVLGGLLAIDALSGTSYGWWDLALTIAFSIVFFVLAYRSSQRQKRGAQHA